MTRIGRSRAFSDVNTEKEKQPSAPSFPPSLPTNTRLVHGARVVLGLVFVVFGVNGFVHAFATPSMPEPANALIDALSASGYLMHFVHATEVVCGALLIANRFVPLALTILAPIIVNIVAFHVFLAPHELAIALVILALEIFLARAYERAFRPMLAARVSPEGTLAAGLNEPLSR